MTWADFDPWAEVAKRGVPAAKPAKAAKVSSAPDLATLAALATQRTRSASWSTTDWREYVAEKSAIREFDGALDHATAELAAVEDAIQHWQAMNPLQASEPEAGCVACGEGTGEIGADAVPVLAADGHVWVHDVCWGRLQQMRRTEAETALAAMGIAGRFGVR